MKREICIVLYNAIVEELSVFACEKFACRISIICCNYISSFEEDADDIDLVCRGLFLLICFYIGYKTFA